MVTSFEVHNRTTLCVEVVAEGRGVHPPEAMMHFPLVSDFPPYFRKISQNFQKFRLSSAKISDNLFSF